MSLQLIQKYYSDLETKIRYGGSRKETAIRTTFQQLLENYATQKNLVLVPELDFRTPQGKTVFPDGTLKDALRESWGYWESKDEADNLDDEIAKKLARGYPSNNILFEDSQTAVLIQRGMEVARVDMKNPTALHGILLQFVNFQPPEVQEFHQAIEQFKQDLPDLVTTLRAEIAEQGQRNPQFVQARADFLAVCQQAINPQMVLDDVREMIIQHILTEDIFMTVFDESHYHRENNIASQLTAIVTTFFKGTIQRNILGKISQYYKIIKAKASQIANHHEKQRFLKILYENFYKAYNPRTADRLGIVYTPQEIVRFMIESAEYLTMHHFGKLLADEGVEILDPATGTGTFITELIEYLPAHRLAYKYEHEIHCNEVAILPYYIANLNIEYTYAQKMGQYAEFKNICFVDTLDNLGFTFAGKQHAMNLGLTPENIERIKRQNQQEISVIIGNPPYNANQLNENENNKNRQYNEIDERIKQTYVKHSQAQKTKVYDMYTRFIRWATDRLNEKGVLAFITNNSFLEARGFDGFRKVVAEEFAEIWIVDLGGNVRQQEHGNVFGIKLGVAIWFMVKKNERNGRAKIFYMKPALATAQDKLDFLTATRFNQIPFDHLRPDEQYRWLNIPKSGFETLLPLADVRSHHANTLFQLVSNGISTNRDEWVYDFSAANLAAKAAFFMTEYNNEVARWIAYKQANEIVETKAESSREVDNFVHARNVIKWSSRIKRDKLRKERLGVFNPAQIRPVMYRPFLKQYLYLDYIPIDIVAQNLQIFPTPEHENFIIAVNNSGQFFGVLASKYPVDLHFNGDSQCLPLYRYDSEGNRHNNITDFALEKFNSHYKDSLYKVSNLIKAEDVFHYVYAVLHDPAYRAKYELNLKREFPRIPFYDDFWQWAGWGQRLMALHVDFETVEGYKLEVRNKKLEGDAKAKLKADKEAGVIEIDTETTLHGVPAVAWEYKLGNRSALEWVLERYGESTPKDPTIREKFNTYRLADYKAEVIALLQRVCTVSVETMRIVTEMGQRT